MIEIKAPNPLTRVPDLFLAGATTKEENWREKISKEFINSDLVIANPELDKWDFEDDSKGLQKQLEWEYDGLLLSRYIFFYFHPSCMCPVSLLELGVFSYRKPIVCCPKNFWKYENVKFICKKYDAYFYEDMDQALSKLKEVLCYQTDCI